MQASLLPYTLVAASSHAFSVDYRPLVLVLLALAAVAAVEEILIQLEARIKKQMLQK